MKNRILSIVIAITLCMTCAFVLPAISQTDSCYAAKTKAKYVKIKKTTYNKMKKTIASQKTTIANQSATIQNQGKAIDQYKTTIADQKATIAEQKLTISERDQTIKDKKQTISWLWSTLEDFGYYYSYDTHKWESDGTAEPEEEPVGIDSVQLTEDGSQVEIIAQETGLTIDCVQVFESYNDWYAYYVYADGDIYVITVKNGHVDVCTQLN